ncbi:MAG: hypothetical protein ABI337_04835 [Nitrososphaera sp.]|jgi:hypothetical protein
MNDMVSKNGSKTTHVWYAGYGSNLFRERFLRYVLGGQFRWGGSDARGCSDKTLPDSRPIMIPHELFFAKNSGSWEDGGVAFVSMKRTKDKQTYGRMWKVTADQFLEIWDQEGMTWYNTVLYLGKRDGLPIITITNNQQLTPTKPSNCYVKTIVAGLKETYQMSDKEILKYLIEKPGISGNYDEQEIISILKDKDIVTISKSIQS